MVITVPPINVRNIHFIRQYMAEDEVMYTLLNNASDDTIKQLSHMASFQQLVVESITESTKFSKNPKILDMVFKAIYLNEISLRYFFKTKQAWKKYCMTRFGHPIHVDDVFESSDFTNFNFITEFVSSIKKYGYRTKELQDPSAEKIYCNICMEDADRRHKVCKTCKNSVCSTCFSKFPKKRISGESRQYKCCPYCREAYKK